jgi:hypothetical protein
MKSQIWGISAQGGDIDNAEIKNQLGEEQKPSHRIKVVDSSGERVSHDITIPIQWIVFE